MSEWVRRVLESKEPLPDRLRTLRAVAQDAVMPVSLLAWGRAATGLDGGDLDAWSRRAWWGLVAGQLVLRGVYNVRAIDDVLSLLESAEWDRLETAKGSGGLICATAHVGPPKFGAHVLARRLSGLMMWAAASGEDSEPLLRATGSRLVDPREVAQRSVGYLQSALHLRRGGTLAAAPDGAQGRRVEVTLYGRRRPCASGLAFLARELKLPCVLVLAVWEGERMRLRVEPMVAPSPELEGPAWERAWVEAYARQVDAAITDSPENLRILRFDDQGAITREMGL